MSTIFPTRDTNFRQWLVQFVTGCNTHATTLGLNAAQLTEIGGLVDGFALSLDEESAAEAAFRAKVEQKRFDRAAAQKMVRGYNKKFRVLNGVTPQILRDLGLPVYGTGGIAEPTTPTELIASGDGNGIVSVQFNRNGNSNRTVFLFEKSASSDGPWEFLGTTTRIRQKFIGFSVGEQFYLRCYAVLGDKKSIPTQSVSVYGGTVAPGISIAA